MLTITRLMCTSLTLSFLLASFCSQTVYAQDAVYQADDPVATAGDDGQTIASPDEMSDYNHDDYVQPEQPIVTQTESDVVVEHPVESKEAIVTVQGGSSRAVKSEAGLGLNSN